jgi:hypothetical protein
MGIMPADRELKWQRVFRRFGLPGEKAENEPAAEKENRSRTGDSKPSDGEKSGERKPGR